MVFIHIILTLIQTLGVQSSVIILPSIGEALDIPASRQQWIVSSYALTFGCFLLLWGRLADVYGKRLVFILGCAWFALMSLITPFVPNEIGFDVIRALQGLGAAANVPTALGILGQTIPPSKAKNMAFACYGAGAPLGSIFGNIIGGVIAQYLSWKWVFWVISIMAALVTVASFVVIPPPPPHIVEMQRQNSAKASVDWIGGTLVTVGLLALMFALTEGNVVGWSTPWIPALIVISIILIVLFAVWQWYLETKTTRPPLMKISIWKNSRFAAAQIIMAFFFASFNNYLIFVTYYYQDYQGLSPIQTTLRFIPTGVVGCVTALTTGLLMSKIRGNHIVLFGTFCVSLSVLLFAVPIPTSTSYFAYGLPAMVLAVFGADTVYPCLTLFTAQSLPSTDQALGGALINAVGQIGRAIGLAIATAVQTSVIAADKHQSVDAVGKLVFEHHDPSFLKGLRAGNWLSFAFGMVACVVVAVAFRGTGKLGKK